MNVLKYVKHLLGIGDCMRTHRLLFEYAQGELDETTRRKLDAHLADCPGCLKFVESYRQTIATTRQCCRHPVEIPPELQRKLEDFIAKKL